MGIFKHCGDLVGCPRCGTIHVIDLGNCTDFANSGESVIKCEACEKLYIVGLKDDHLFVSHENVQAID